MSADPSHNAQLLRDARVKAEKLLAGLLAQAQDLDRFTRQVAPEKLARGREAFADAIASARRTLDGIDHALAATSPAPGRDALNRQ